MSQSMGEAHHAIHGLRKSPLLPARGDLEGPRKDGVGPVDEINWLGLTFRGLAERGRELEYLEGLVRALEGRLGGGVGRAQALELADALAQLSERLARLAERLRKRAGSSGAQA